MHPNSVNYCDAFGFKRVQLPAGHCFPSGYFGVGNGRRFMNDLAAQTSGDHDGVFTPGPTQLQEPLPDMQTGGVTEYPAGILPVQAQAFSAFAKRCAYLGKKLARSLIWVSI